MGIDASTLGEAPGSYWAEFLGAEKQLDTGPLWFVGVLLLLSLAYACWMRLRRHRAVGREARTVTARHLIRLVYPFGSDSGFTDLNLWQWPACIAVFTLGIAASSQGWLTAVPDRLRRHGRSVTLAAVAIFAASAASVCRSPSLSSSSHAYPRSPASSDTCRPSHRSRKGVAQPKHLRPAV